MEEPLSGGFPEMKGDQAQRDDTCQISDQGQRENGNKKGQVFGQLPLVKINID